MFLWEVFMGKDNFKQMYKKDKKRIFMFIILILLSVYSVTVTKRLIQISNTHVKLKQEMKALGCVPPTDSELAQEEIQSVLKPKITAASEPMATKEEYNRAKHKLESFDEIERLK